MVLLPPPVPEAPEEVVGEEAADGVADDVDVDRLLYPEPARVIGKTKVRASAAVPQLFRGGGAAHLVKFRKWTWRV